MKPLKAWEGDTHFKNIWGLKGHSKGITNFVAVCTFILSKTLPPQTEYSIYIEIQTFCLPSNLSGINNILRKTLESISTVVFCTAFEVIS